METKKHHYRNVLKSDHLGIADLEDFVEAKKPLTFTISHAKQELGVSVAGRKGDFNVVYFKESIKPLVVNSTNGKQIALFAGSPFVEDWNNIPVELYIDETVKMKGETVGGVRIRPVQPSVKVLPPFTEANFLKAKQKNATIELIKTAYTITPEVEKAYNNYQIPADVTTK
jgi:hypothetical protein